MIVESTNAASQAELRVMPKTRSSGPLAEAKLKLKMALHSEYMAKIHQTNGQTCIVHRQGDRRELELGAFPEQYGRLF